MIILELRSALFVLFLFWSFILIVSGMRRKLFVSIERFCEVDCSFVLQGEKKIVKCCLLDWRRKFDCGRKLDKKREA